MYLYSYSYKKDSTQEIIGSVHAIDFDEAVQKICIVKQLSAEHVLDLFTIRKVEI